MAKVTYNHVVHGLDTALVVVGLLAFVLLVVLAVRRWLAWHWQASQAYVILHMTPPHFNDKQPSTSQLFKVLHSINSLRSTKDRLLGRRVVISLELVSTKSGGIKYLARVPANSQSLFKQLLSAHLPSLKLEVISDPLTGFTSDYNLVEFQQSGHYAYPLLASSGSQQHDPVAYISGAMTKLDAQELIAWQFIIDPSSDRRLKRLFNKLAKGKTGRVIDDRWLRTKLVRLINALLGALAELLGELFGGNYAGAKKPLPKDQPVPSASSKRLLDTIQTKLAEPPFKVDVRLVVSGPDVKIRQDHLKALVAAAKLFHNPGYQALQPKSKLWSLVPQALSRYKLTMRLPSLIGDRNLLSPSELAELYHFPYGISEIENLATSLSRDLPAPLSLKQEAALDVVVGRNVHQGLVTPIGLSRSERERHVYIVGGTGNGKTTMLRYAIIQDFLSGKGVSVIDPHGDLAESLLAHIPEKRLRDVIYFDPDDLGYPLSLNLLETTKGLSGDELLREQDQITESVVSIFRKFFSDSDWGGHRIEYIIRNTIHTAFTCPEPTIRTLYRLLTDPSFRYKTIRDLDDEDLVNFWREEFAKAGSFQRVKMASGVTTKLGRFLRSASVARVMEDYNSTIDFDKIINNGQLLICNFSKGRLGEDTSTLFGATVLAKLQLSALKRARIGESKRVPHYVYVDEFQNFSTRAFVEMLSEARKYKLFMTMAEQSTAQQVEPRLTNIVLANAGSLICFRTASPSDEQLLLPQFRPFLSSGDLANLPTYKFYAKLAAVHSQPPLSGETIVLEDPPNLTIARKAKASSRKLYARKYHARPKKVSGTTTRHQVIAVPH